ncbi:hypothetical protein [Mycoplasmoides pirum]|uniref:hypothetical protein n=1 Tax=Mycoplasmoides pirum TaxID=2122 RepID=UPI0004868470|nr:hypothetical protein [Mycoplasmoides pirum]
MKYCGYCHAQTYGKFSGGQIAAAVLLILFLTIVGGIIYICLAQKAVCSICDKKYAETTTYGQIPTPQPQQVSPTTN